jgi:hypothetical protein
MTASTGTCASKLNSRALRSSRMASGWSHRGSRVSGSSLGAVSRTHRSLKATSITNVATTRPLVTEMREVPHCLGLSSLEAPVSTLTESIESMASVKMKYGRVKRGYFLGLDFPNYGSFLPLFRLDSGNLTLLSLTIRTVRRVRASINCYFKIITQRFERTYRCFWRS